MKKIFCIVGRSASGKDSLVREAKRNLGLKELCSYTTRPPRFSGENTHIFTTEDRMIEHAHSGAIAAIARIGDWYYWSTIPQLYECDLYVIDYASLPQLKALELADVEFVTIYVTAPAAERRKRALLRQPGCEDTYDMRVAAENEQFSQMEEMKDWDYCIHNISFMEAYYQFEQIIKTERTKINEI